MVLQKNIFRILNLCLLLTLSAKAQLREVGPFSSNLKITGSTTQIQEFQRFQGLAAQKMRLLSHLAIQKSAAVEVQLLPLIDSPGTDPGYLPEAKVLQLGPLAECQSTSPVDFTAVNLHEFAHSIFSPNFQRVFKITSEAPLAERYDSKSARKDPRAELEKLATLRDLAAPFDEVFADAFAVLALNDPKALQTPLTECGTADVLRDFSAGYPVRGWDEGSLKPISLPISSGNAYEIPGGGSTETQFLFIDAKVHNVLSPFRTVIWNEFQKLKSRKTADAESRIIAATFNASVKIIGQLQSEKLTFEKWFAISKEELNKRVIVEFRNQLKAK